MGYVVKHFMSKLENLDKIDNFLRQHNLPKLTSEETEKSKYRFVQKKQRNMSIEKSKSSSLRWFYVEFFLFFRANNFNASKITPECRVVKRTSWSNKDCIYPHIGTQSMSLMNIKAKTLNPMLLANKIQVYTKITLHHDQVRSIPRI